MTVFSLLRGNSLFESAHSFFSTSALILFLLALLPSLAFSFGFNPDTAVSQGNPFYLFLFLVAFFFLVATVALSLFLFQIDERRTYRSFALALLSVLFPAFGLWMVPLRLAMTDSLEVVFLNRIPHVVAMWHILMSLTALMHVRQPRWWRSPYFFLPVLFGCLTFLSRPTLLMVLWLPSWLPGSSPLLLLLLGVTLYFRLFRFQPSHFTASLVLMEIPLVAAMLYFDFSTVPFDSHFNLGLGVSAFSLALPLIGVMLDFRFTLADVHEQLLRKQALLYSMEAQLDEHATLVEELESQRGLLEITLSAIGEAILTTDTHGRINFMNPIAERMLGKPLPDICLKYLSQVCVLRDMEHHLEMRDPFEPLLQGMRMGGSPRQALLETSEVLLPVQYSGSPILSRENVLIGAVIVFHDISEQRRVELELAEARDRALAASNSKSEFLASVSHEIRTPMNAILGMVDLLMETRLTHDQMKYVRTFKGASESLLLLINDILDISIMESGHIHLELIPFDLRDLIEVQVNLFKKEGDKKALELHFEVDDNVPSLLIGDPGRLGQILFNLVGNAIKFTHAGLVIIRVTRTDHNYYHFSVSDTGIGIPQEKQSKIFDIFTQADASTTREYGGTGLGLAICRNLVVQMGGNIWVDSRLDHGSVFHFNVVLEEGDLANLEDMSNDDDLPPEVVGDDRPLSILLVEDSPDNRLLINFYLKTTPYHLEIAENGKLAVETFLQRQGAFDLILMDIQMPVMDGYSATRRIREIEEENEWEPCAITALTASVLDESMHKSYEAGCDAHLKKPIKKNTLLKAIFKHTRGRPLKINLVSICRLDMARATESELAELIPGYLRNRHKDLEALLLSIEAEHYDRIKSLGHRMKGSGAGYGLNMISEYGALLEGAAIARDKVHLRRVASQFRAYLKLLDQMMREKPPGWATDGEGDEDSPKEEPES